MPSTDRTRLLDLVLVGVLLALGWVVWIRRLGINDLDDAASNEALFALEPVRRILFDPEWSDQSPFYFLVLHFCNGSGQTLFSVRMLNVLVVSALVSLLFAVARIAFRSGRVAAVVALVAVASPLSFWLVRSGRMYGLEVLFSVAALYATLRHVEEKSWKTAIGVAAACALGAYNHFFGLVVSAIVAAFLLLEAMLQHLERRGTDGLHAGMLLAPIFLTALLTLPQAVRILALAQSPPRTLTGWSLPPVSPAFAQRLAGFFFTGASWEALGAWAGPAQMAYYGALALLAITGAALASARFTNLFLLSIGSLCALGAFSRSIDLRERYLVYLVPMLWLAIANGAASPVVEGMRPPWLRRTAQSIQVALLAIVLAASAWSVSRQVPEKYPEWTKLMTALYELHRDPVSLYMPPGTSIGIPRAVVRRLELPGSFREILEHSLSTRERFLEEAGSQRDFLFLRHWSLENAESEWRAEVLRSRGYREIRLPVWEAMGTLYTLGPGPRFTRDEPLGGLYSPAGAVEWANARLSRTPPPARSRSILEHALVARIELDGTVRRSVFYASQNGESGYWKLGDRYWDALYETTLRSGGTPRDVIWAHPKNGSVLLVAFPAVELGRGLDFAYGIDDTGLVYQNPAGVDARIFFDREQVATLHAADEAGWKYLWIGAGDRPEGRATLTVLIETPNDRGRHFAFDFSARGSWPW